MAAQKPGKLNQLDRMLPEGLLVDAAWLSRHGYSTSLRAQYVAAGWLTQPARRVYARPRGEIGWQSVVVSLQALLGHTLVVGGRTALGLLGYEHYLAEGPKDVHLYGPKPPPTWLAALRIKERFVYRNSTALFGDDLADLGLPRLDQPGPPGVGDGTGANQGLDPNPGLEHAALRVLPVGHWSWPMVVSSPERSVLELLDELPGKETFHQVDMLMEGLGDLSPRRLQQLLGRCGSVKVKRLFFFFADRHEHAWLKHIDRSRIDLGHGKRMLVKGGRLDKTYLITVPAAFHGVR